jgi:hypothetical protein
LPADADDPRADRLPGRIVHVHIPKTAGTALAEAFKQAYGERLRIYPILYESEYGQIGYSEFNFFGGHIGFKIASEVANAVNGDLITVLRDPVDRYVSDYYFLRQQYISGEARNHKTYLAGNYDLDQFVQITDEPILQKEFLNRTTWQLAYSHRLELRQDLIDAGIGDDDLVRLAIANLRQFAIVGTQSDMASLAKAVRRRYDVKLLIGRVNVTASRVAKSDLTSKTLSHIERWVHLDTELYRRWIGARQPADASLGSEITS